MRYALKQAVCINMKCILFLAVTSFLLVIARSANQCKDANIPCLNKGVCKMLQGKSLGNCFQGVCGKKGGHESKQCKITGTLCLAKRDCKNLKGKVAGKCFKGVCCKTDPYTTLTQLGSTPDTQRIKYALVKSKPKLPSKRSDYLAQ
ncbi:uncharacterized protein LOC119169399 isoform X2 [Rhipicephalus microplus]|uniref:uncharacterized protein LOC119169399 isoform X2 n=1 Tax=Rhipicephalus microplus TaxID=6941 RepID=UPI003F6AEF2A